MELQVEPMFKLVIGSHFFKVLNPTPRMTTLLLSFCSEYILYEYSRERNKRPELKPSKVFAARTRDNMEFRFHRGQMKAFFRMLEFEFIEPHLYQVEYMPTYTPAKIKVNAKPGWKLREQQEDAKGFVLKTDHDDLSSRLISMPTGSGKTCTALLTIVDIKTRTIVVVLPKYIDKWLGDITNILDTNPKKVMAIQGSKPLKGLIQMANDEAELPDFIVISLDTIQNFFKAYELNRFSDEFLDYGCMPEDLCKVLGVGNVIIDETHEHLHAVFKFLIYTNVSKVIALSATFITSEPFINKIHHLMFPKEIRFDEIKMDKYIKVYSLSYSFKNYDPRKIKTTEYGSNTYSHTAFEKSLLRKGYLTENYLELIRYVLKIGYIDNYIKGDKVVIYAATIDMCTEIVKYLKAIYPQYDVRRYVEQDPYSNIMEADITATTVLSAGTAVDIDNLRTVIMTNNILSPVSNLQSLGRLRNLSDRDVKYYYIYCEQIKKQVDFHHRRMELYADRVASHKEFRSPITV